MQSSRPPERNWILSRVAHGLLWLFGWQAEGAAPNLPKFVVVAAPHTSNWDGLFMFIAAWAYRIKLYWMGKHSLFWPPLGWLLHWLGGIPIDRSAPQGAVQQMTQAFQQHDRMILLLTPEGTRRKTERWKTGFYYIAQGAQVPIVLAYIDYARKVIGFGPVMIPSGDLEADMQVIHQFYADKTARYPEKRTLPLGNPPEPDH